jgi:hypothetical protein
MHRAGMISLGLLAAVTVSGCVTKMYGRQAELTPAEQSGLSCQQIGFELAKVDDYSRWVTKKSEYDGWDLLAVVGDLGIGNGIERGEALKSADLRREQLTDLQRARSCDREAAVQRPVPPQTPAQPLSQGR